MTATSTFTQLLNSDYLLRERENERERESREGCLGWGGGTVFLFYFLLSCFVVVVVYVGLIFLAD